MMMMMMNSKDIELLNAQSPGAVPRVQCNSVEKMICSDFLVGFVHEYLLL